MNSTHDAPLAPAFIVIDVSDTRAMWQLALSRAAARHRWHGENEIRHLHDALDFADWSNQHMADIWRTALARPPLAVPTPQAGRAEFNDAMAEALLRLQGAIRNARFAEIMPQGQRLLAIIVAGQTPLDLFVGAAPPFWSGESLIFWTGPTCADDDGTLFERPDDARLLSCADSAQHIVDLLYAHATQRPRTCFKAQGSRHFWA